MNGNQLRVGIGSNKNVTVMETNISRFLKITKEGLGAAMIGQFTSLQATTRSSAGGNVLIHPIAFSRHRYRYPRSYLALSSGWPHENMQRKCGRNTDEREDGGFTR